MPVTVRPQPLRLTPQRRAVLDILEAAHDHPTAADVYDRVRVHAPGIGAATVYRTLALLVREGMALELQLGDSTPGRSAASRYDANTGRHDHLVCDSCGRAVDVDSPIPADLIASLAETTGFRIGSYDLQFRGLCPECSACS